MRFAQRSCFALVLALTSGCSTIVEGTGPSQDDPGDGDGDGDGDGPVGDGDGDGDGPVGDGDGDGDGDGPVGDGDGDIGSTVDALMALVEECDQVSPGMFAHDSDGPADVPVCGLEGALFWRADLDIDCDGVWSEQCNESTDPWWQNQTSGKTSSGDWLDAATLPYVVIPQVNERFSYEEADLDIGSVVAVIYQGQLAFGVFGDAGPADIIGEASYAMAELLGINPDPAVGGASDEVVYIAFQGEQAQSWPLEDHAAATALGGQLVAETLANNR
jgi:hypothetical protein